MDLTKLDSPFLRYLIDLGASPGDRLPALADISRELGVSTGKLREQLEVARSLGVVSVRPRLGIQRERFNFAQSLLNSVLFSQAMGEATFEQYSRLRQVVEVGFWDEAVRLLTVEDKEKLRLLVSQAWTKLRGDAIHIPTNEHRDLHLTVFSRLENPFVQGILASYWDDYEASELTRFASYTYWIDVWTYHERIVEALCQDDFERGRQLLIEHFSLLRGLPQAALDLSSAGARSRLSSEGENE